MPKNALPKDYDSQIKQLTAMAMSVLHNPNNKIEESQIPAAYERAVESVQHEDDAGAKAVADVTMFVFAQVEGQLKARKKKLLPVVILGAVGSIVTQVAEVAVAAGIVEMNEEDIQIAIATAINLFIAKAKGEGSVNDQQLREAAQALQKKYPQEAANFQKMVGERQKRQSGKQAQVEQPQEMAQTEQPQQGLLKGQ